jgi:3-methylfumaryl-CoA hydratase
MSEWDAWIGRVDARADQVDPALVRRWCATLDRDVPDGGAAPQGLHWCLAVPDAPTAALGEDGHPRRDDGPGSFLPPVPLPRRMWASSTVRFHAALPIGATILRTSRVAAITTKQGGSGTLVFVDIAHDTHHGDTLLVSELQSVVYRAAAPTGAVAVPPPWGAARIHYDLPYARDEEGYRGLIVHGPLIASLLLDLARRHVGDNRLATFRFRGLSPAVAGEPLHLALREEAGELVLGAFARDGRQVTDASAGLSSPWPALSG